MNTKFNVEIPFFPGFYDSWLYSSDTEYYGIREEIDYYNDETGYDNDLDDDDFEFDYERYKNEVTDAFIDASMELLPNDILVSIDKDSKTIDSPRWYNFRTDELFADIVLVDDWYDKMVAFINTNSEWFADRIKNEWTSYDGFDSYMGNTIDEWIEGLKNEDERYISCMLGYIAYFNNNNIKNDYIYYTLDDIYVGAYISLNESGKEKVQAAYDKMHQPGWDMTNQTKIEFPE